MAAVTLTYKAIEHFDKLLRAENEDNLNLRMVVERPGTIEADLGIMFCPQGEQEANDQIVEYEGFKIYIDQYSAPFLENAVIDFSVSESGGELSVKAPLIRGELPNPDAPLAERVNFVLDKYINPNLAQHGGSVTLHNITQDNSVQLTFGGGCQGCSMSQLTLKNSVEKTLLHYCKDVTRVEDSTDHVQGTNPYC